MFQHYLLIFNILLNGIQCLNAAEENILVVTGRFDGANPQSADSIIRESSDRFRIKPVNEEGSNDSYYFRFNTKVINNSDKELGIELIIEWPVLRSHPDYPYDTYYYGDMGNWRWTYASIKGIEARIHINVPPGTTYVGCYPRYSYEYFEEFMNTLNPGKILKKWVEGKSYYNRNIWCLRITDPDVPDKNKNTILITSRNHPYETSGSYITEEMIKFLISDNIKAKQLIENNIIYLMPMLNPDGVFLGMNQRTRPNGTNISFGVESSDPEATTLLQAVDKIRPFIWADIHSWPHKGDDGMWCTHQWIAKGLLSIIPNYTFNDYFWDVSFVEERNTPEDHLWKWLMRNYNSGGVSLSISWYRRNEEDIRYIGVAIINALGEIREHK